MATDAYVMPLWRFLADDFATPLEAAFGAITIVTSGETTVRKRPSRVGFLRRYTARRRARSIVRASERAAGTLLRWRDEGEVIYSNQFRSGDTIRSYLWWLDRKDLLPEPVNSPPPHEALAAFWQCGRERPQNFPHLQTNNYWNGLFLPVDFPCPVLIDKERNHFGETVGRPICSPVVALREVERVTLGLPAPEDYMDAWERYGDSDAWVGVKMAFHHLRTILRHSIASGLPAIFWG
jgi:hypothetical protein